MTDHQDDRLFSRAGASLRTTRPRDEEALAELIATLRREAEDAADLDDAIGVGSLLIKPTSRTRGRRRPLVTRGAVRFIAGLAAGIAFAAGLGIGIWSGWRMRGASYRLAAEDMGLRTPIRAPLPVSDPTFGTATQPVQFMFVAPSATRVALVGEFNDWDPAATPMARVGGGAWHVSLPLTRGRHVYAFIVDGSSWVADPQAPMAPERWFGAQNSVMLVSAEPKR